MLPTDKFVKAAAKGLFYHHSNKKLFILAVIMTLVAIIDCGIRNNLFDFKNGWYGINPYGLYHYAEKIKLPFSGVFIEDEP